MGMAAPLCAQDSKIPPLPAGPLLKRAPDYSTWTVTCQGHPLEASAPLKTGTTGEGSHKDKEPVTMFSTVIKTGSTILEQNVDAGGQRHQIWHASGIRVIPVPGSSNPMVCPDYGGGDIVSINFASSDFSGFDWLSQSTYTGIVKYQGNDCIVFNGTVSPLSVREQMEERGFIEQSRALGQSVPDALKVPAVACIDLQTRLPLYAQFGHEKRVYQYGAPPTAPLALPTELAGPVKAYVQKIARLSAPASRAY
jgi:hypothetical protein